MRVPAFPLTGRASSSSPHAGRRVGRFATWFAIVLLIGLLPSTAAVAQVATSGDTGAVDSSREFERRSMSFFDTYISESAASYLRPQDISNIERVVRQQVEGLGRFQDVVGIGVPGQSPEDFVAKLQAWIQENAADVAADRLREEGRNYNFEYRDTIVTGEAIAQVLESAYAYSIAIDPIRFGTESEPYSPQAPRFQVATQFDAATIPVPRRPNLNNTDLEFQRANPQRNIPPRLVYTSRDRMTPGVRDAYIRLVEGNADWEAAIRELFRASNDEDLQLTRVRVQYQGVYKTARVPVRVTFYKIEIRDEMGNMVDPSRAVIRVRDGENTFTSMGRQTNYLMPENSPEWLDRQLVLQIEDNLPPAQVRRILEEESSELARRGELESARDAAEDPPGGVGGWIRGIPEFRVRAFIDERQEDNVAMRPGRSEDVYLDEWFRIYQPDDQNNQIYLGWTKVRSVGPGITAAGTGASRADQERSVLQIYTGDPEVGYMLEEYPFGMFQFDLTLGYDFLIGNTEALEANSNQTVQEVAGLFRIGVFFGANLAPYVGISEFHIGLDLSIGFATDFLEWTVGLVIKKKFNWRRWVLDFGVTLGATQLANSSDEGSAIREFIDATAGPGDLTSPVFFMIEPKVRISYFFSPHFEIHAQATVRFNLGDNTGFGFTDIKPNSFPEFEWRTVGFSLALGLTFYI